MTSLLFRALKRLVQHTVQTARASELPARQIANIANGAARSGRNELLSMLSAAWVEAAEQSMGNFNSQGLANTAWAFATASQEDASCFAALATAAKQRLGDFNSQELVNTA